MAQNGEKWSFFGRKMTIFRNFRAEIGSGGLSRGVTFKIWPKTNIFPCSHFSGRPGLAGYQSEDFVKNDPYFINGLVPNYKIKSWNVVIGAAMK